MTQAMTLHTKAKEAHAPSAHAPTSFMYALMKAMEKDQATISQQQITDAETAETDAQIETTIYNYYTYLLGYYAQLIAKYQDPDYQKHHKKSWKKDLADAQGQYNKYSAAAPSAEGQQDGAVQAAQEQTSSDASNLQMKVQLAQGIESILAALSALLGRITA